MKMQIVLFILGVAALLVLVIPLWAILEAAGFSNWYGYAWLLALCVLVNVVAESKSIRERKKKINGHCECGCGINDCDGCECVCHYRIYENL